MVRWGEGEMEEWMSNSCQVGVTVNACDRYLHSRHVR